MNLAELATTIYKNSKELKIIQEIYDDDIFSTTKWKYQNKSSINHKKGWYWIEIPLTFEELAKLKLKKGKEQTKRINITETIQNNLKTFPEEFINKKCSYNGEAQTLAGRLRSHFYLINQTTGALGLNAYPELKKITITVRTFSEEQLNLITEESERNAIERLITNKVGRTAIENAWRAINGFPILCKS